MDLTFLLLLSLPLPLNLEYWDPNIKTLWYDFVSVKEELSHNSTLEIFMQEVKVFYWMMTQDK